MKKQDYFFIILVFLMIAPVLLQGNTTFTFADFNDGKADKNGLGFVASSFQRDGGTCVFSAENNYDNVYGRFGYSLCLAYDVRTPNCFAGYWSKMHGMNLSGYRYLSFYVKGATGREFFKVQIKIQNGGADSSKSDVYINDFIEGGLSTEWKKVVIPLDAFIQLKNRTQVDELIFVFENYQSSMNGSVLKSAVYIDNIVFGTKSPGYLTIDNFGDLFTPLAIGGNAGSGGNLGTVSNFISTDYFNLHPNGLKLNYNVNAGTSYAYYFMIPGGGEDGWTKANRDLSAYQDFSFSIRAESQAKNPCGIKAEVKDYSENGTGEPFYVITNSASRHIRTNWQKFSIALSNFRDFDSVKLDPSRVQELVFTFENGNASNKIGTVYIDEIQFEEAGFSNKTAVPQAPWALTDNGNPVSDNFTLNNNSKLMVQAGSASTDPLLECVRFEFSRDGVNWHVFKTDYDVSDSSYEAGIDPDNFSFGDVVLLRVVSENIWGHTALLGPFGSVKFSRTGYSAERPGKLISRFAVDNNPFSPNGDDMADTARFVYTLMFPSAVSLKVFDASGGLVYKKEEALQAAGAGQSIEWNGKDMNNAFVKNGLYFYSLEARAQNGSEDKIIQIIGVIK